MVAYERWSLTRGGRKGRFDCICVTHFSHSGIVGLNNIKANDYLNVVLQVRDIVPVIILNIFLCSTLFTEQMSEQCISVILETSFF